MALNMLAIAVCFASAVADSDMKARSTGSHVGGCVAVGGKCAETPDDVVVFLQHGLLHKKGKLETNSVSGWQDTISCKGKSYSKIGVAGKGQFGEAAIYQTEGGGKVVMKMNQDGGFLNSENDAMREECGIMEKMAKAGLKHMLHCDDVCEPPAADQTKVVIVTSPYVEEPISFERDKPLAFKNAEAEVKAVRETLTAGVSMINSNFVNPDQGNNILYLADGTPLFVDFGIATDKATTYHDDEEDEEPVGATWKAFVEFMVGELLEKIPQSMWNSFLSKSITPEAVKPLCNDEPEKRRANDDDSQSFAEWVDASRIKTWSDPKIMSQGGKKMPTQNEIMKLVQDLVQKVADAFCGLKFD